MLDFDAEKRKDRARVHGAAPQVRGCLQRRQRMNYFGSWDWRRAGLALLCFTMCAMPLTASAASSDEEMLRNVALVLIPREILFFSAQAGQWTSVRLEAGERILQRGADGNVAAVVTSQRTIGFSAALNVTQE